MIYKVITWFKKLFVKEKPIKKYKFPAPKGYVVYTDEGGKFNCTSQKNCSRNFVCTLQHKYQ